MKLGKEVMVMAQYKTFDIEFLDWNDNPVSYYEVAVDVKGALECFYADLKKDGCGMTRLVNICESTSDNYYIVRDVEDGDVFEYRYDTEGEVFYNVSKHYAFDDCCPEFEVEAIVCGGRPVHYVGWQPMMKFEYKYDDGEVAWTCWHGEWEH